MGRSDCKRRRYASGDSGLKSKRVGENRDFIARSERNRFLFAVFAERVMSSAANMKVSWFFSNEAPLLGGAARFSCSLRLTKVITISSSPILPAMGYI